MDDEVELVITLVPDTGPLMAAMEAFKQFPHEFGLFLSEIEGSGKLAAFETQPTATPGTHRVIFKPSQLLLDALAAARARHFE